MVEVFKTDITGREQARLVVEKIHTHFKSYKANVDLHDCDNILRVECQQGTIDSIYLLNKLRDWGWRAEILS